MVYKIADNVLSPLGVTTAQNYRAVKGGGSALHSYQHWNGVEGPFAASLFTAGQTSAMAIEGLSRFESLAVASARAAISGSGIDVGSPRVLFVLSTTKANIETGCAQPAESALLISRHLGFRSQPVVVCNACLSGLSAIVLAQRLLEAGHYDQAVVCGADVQSAFTVAGFLSLKALAAQPCRPFDIDRTGLNLGEAAATVVLSRHAQGDGPLWAIAGGAVRNDAYHVLSPSKTAVGARLALEALGGDGADFINAHGTGTLYNDQMEAVAISHSCYAQTAVNGLKGYFGHTLGAAGLLETVISMAAADDHTLPGTRGYSEPGTTGQLRLSAGNKPTPGRAFVKMMSGFGGCNGALLCRKVLPQATDIPVRTPKIRKLHSVRIAAPQSVVQLYKQHIGDYPRFYKMDPLSRLGFVAAELLLQDDGARRRLDSQGQCAVVLCNHSSSVAADSQFRQTMADYPSPSLFIYTLPNIVTGEIAIRHHLTGETSFYILPQRSDELVWKLVETTFQDAAIGSVIGGWIDYDDDQHYVADLFLVEREGETAHE